MLYLHRNESECHKRQQMQHYYDYWALALHMQDINETYVSFLQCLA